MRGLFLVAKDEAWDLPAFLDVARYDAAVDLIFEWPDEGWLQEDFHGWET